MAPHPPFKQSAITPLPLPLPLAQFSSQQNMFDPSKELPKSFVSLSDHLRLSDSYGSYDDHAMNYGSKVTETAQNHAGYGGWNTMVNDEFGISSPPLWRTSPRRGVNVDHRCLSPSSRAQAIARGQRELMEMVSKMPESCYELTLKDLVEYQQQPVVDEPKQDSFAEGRGSNSVDELNKYKKERQNSRKQQINRSGSLDNGGFLLKMVFPFSLVSKKKKNPNIKKKNDCSTSNNSRVSPKPPVVADASAKTVDKDWWKKRSESSESDGGGSTVNSGSAKSSRSSSINSSGSGRSNSSRSISSTTGHRHRRKGCWAFIFSRKTKASR